MSDDSHAHYAGAIHQAIMTQVRPYLSEASAIRFTETLCNGVTRMQAQLAGTVEAVINDSVVAEFAGGNLGAADPAASGPAPAALIAGRKAEITPDVTRQFADHLGAILIATALELIHDRREAGLSLEPAPLLTDMARKLRDLPPTVSPVVNTLLGQVRTGLAAQLKTEGVAISAEPYTRPAAAPAVESRPAGNAPQPAPSLFRQVWNTVTGAVLPRGALPRNHPALAVFGTGHGGIGH